MHIIFGFFFPPVVNKVSKIHLIMNDTTRSREILPDIVSKIPINKNVVDLIISRYITARTVNWSSSKGCNISLVGSLVLKALHKRKEILKGICLCQMWLLRMFLSFFCLHVLQAELHEENPFSSGFHTVVSLTPGWNWSLKLKSRGLGEGALPALKSLF